MKEQNQFQNIIEQYILHLNQNKILTKCFNEKSFQHDLGQFISNKLGNNYVVQYERNAKYFRCTKNKPYFNIKNNKKELDIVILKKHSSDIDFVNCVPECSIEIKYQKYFLEDLSKTVQSPTKTLYEHLRDIELIEQCKACGFKNAFSIFLADHPFCYTKEKRKAKYENLHNIYKGTNNTGINKNILQRVNRELEKNKKWRKVDISGEYSFEWKKVRCYTDELGHPLDLRYILEKDNVCKN